MQEKIEPEAENNERPAVEEPSEQVAGEEPEKDSRGRRNRASRKIEALHQENDKLSAEKAEIHDKYIRLYSEFDNYRRRTQKEKLDIIKNASEKIIVGLLPVLDDMERAMKYERSGNEPDNETDREGLTLIYNKMYNYLKQQGLEEIHAVGEPFNVDLHEAVTTVPATKEEEKGLVLDEIQKGYKLNEKVIRFSKVVIYQ